MLECGYDLAEPPSDIENALLVRRCMEKSGFRRKAADEMDLSFDSSCKNYPDSPACKLPIEEVPNRDPARRLNSRFCQKYRNAFICQP